MGDEFWETVQICRRNGTSCGGGGRCGGGGGGVGGGGLPLVVPGAPRRGRRAHWNVKSLRIRAGARTPVKIAAGDGCETARDGGFMSDNRVCARSKDSSDVGV